MFYFNWKSLKYVRTWHEQFCSENIELFSTFNFLKRLGMKYISTFLRDWVWNCHTACAYRTFCNWGLLYISYMKTWQKIIHFVLFNNILLDELNNYTCGRYGTKEYNHTNNKTLTPLFSLLPLAGAKCELFSQKSSVLLIRSYSRCNLFLDTQEKTWWTISSLN